jgi:hypothetical protein
LVRFVNILIFCLFAGIPIGSLAQEAAVVEENQPAELQKKEKGKRSKSKSEKQGGLNLFRGFLSQFNLGISTGYGATFYKHDLKGFGVYQPDGGLSVYIFDQAFVNRDTLPVIYSDWVNNPFGIGGLIIPVDTLSSPIITNGIPVFPNDIKFGYDSIRIGYKSTTHNIPLTIALSMDLDRYRLGGGFTMEFHRMTQFRPTALTDDLHSFKTNFTAATFKKYFGFVGITTYESWKYKMLADIEFGKVNRGKNFNKSLISSGLYFNFGYTIEKKYSEYFNLFIRPSIEWKSYTVSIPETSLEVNHRQPAIYIKFGATIRMPELARCPVKGCKIQINHVHGGKEYRSRVHPFWKWQNPKYGQNHPVPLRNKGKT